MGFTFCSMALRVVQRVVVCWLSLSVDGMMVDRSGSWIRAVGDRVIQAKKDGGTTKRNQPVAVEACLVTQFRFFLFVFVLLLGCICSARRRHRA